MPNDAPGDVALVRSLEGRDGAVHGVVNRRVARRQRVHDRLEGGHGAQRAHDGRPVDRHGGRGVAERALHLPRRGGGSGRREQRAAEDGGGHLRPDREEWRNGQGGGAVPRSECGRTDGVADRRHGRGRASAARSPERARGSPTKSGRPPELPRARGARPHAPSGAADAHGPATGGRGASDARGEWAASRGTWQTGHRRAQESSSPPARPRAPSSDFIDARETASCALERSSSSGPLAAERPLTPAAGATNLNLLNDPNTHLQDCTNTAVGVLRSRERDCRRHTVHNSHVTGRLHARVPLPPRAPLLLERVQHTRLRR